MTKFDDERYGRMPYRRCGRSGLKLPAISLGLWQFLGVPGNEEICRQCLYHALDQGVTHFDLANNYGPPAGNSEIVFGQIVKDMPRDELIISTKAGFYMWPGPYGEWGSKKNLVASLDQSLKRMGLEYVDIFYHHRPDPETPLEETLGALDLIVKQGKALYAGVSNYRGPQFLEAQNVVRARGLTPITIHQPYYNMLDRWVEAELLGPARLAGTGIIAFCPLAQGVLTDKYLDGLPETSRMGRRGADGQKWYAEHEAKGTWKKVRALHDLARQRGQSLAQMALAWLLKDERVTSVLIGASSKAQLSNSLAAVKQLAFSAEELAAIERILAG
jgi:L-glyceraldehyde 3-phosphate reductase